MEAVGLVPYEKILVADVENGNRFETYAIAGKRGSHCCCSLLPVSHTVVN